MKIMTERLIYLKLKGDFNMSWYFCNSDLDYGCAVCKYDSVCPYSDREARIELFRSRRENEEYYKRENYDNE